MPQQFCWPTAGLKYICPQTELNDHPASLGRHVVSISCFPAVVGFLDDDYRYESVVTQISHDAGLAPISYTGRKFLPYRRLNQRRSLK